MKRRAVFSLTDEFDSLESIGAHHAASVRLLRASASLVIDAPTVQTLLAG